MSNTISFTHKVIRDGVPLSVPQMLQELREGPFSGRGGARALARALGVTKLTLHNWRTGKSRPNYDNRIAIIALYREEV